MVPYFAAPKPPAAAPWPFGILPLKPSKSWTKNRLRHFRPWFLLISRESHGELPEKNEHQEDFWSLWHRNAMWSPKNTPIRRTIPPWTGRSVEPPVLRSFLAHLSIPKVFGGPWYFQALVPCFVLKLTMAIRLQSNALFLTPRWQYVHYVLQEIPVENASRIDHDRSSFTVYIYIYWLYPHVCWFMSNPHLLMKSPLSAPSTGGESSTSNSHSGFTSMHWAALEWCIWQCLLRVNDITKYMISYDISFMYVCILCVYYVYTIYYIQYWYDIYIYIVIICYITINY